MTRSRDLGRCAVLAGMIAWAAVTAQVAEAQPAEAEPALAFDERELARRLVLVERFERGGQFYRAIGVLEEVRLFAPSPELRRWASLRIAVAYHRGGQHDPAVAAYDVVLGEPETPAARHALVVVQRAAARADQELADPGHTALGDLVAELAPLAARRDDAGFHASFLRARVAAVAGDGAALRDSLVSARTSCTGAAGCDALSALERELARRPPRRRSPLLAVGLSAVVPGVGSWYAGHPVDALYYGGLTSLTGLGALEVYDGSRALSDQPLTFWGLATASGLFYLSSLLHANVAARRFNATERHRWLRRVWEGSATPLPLAGEPPPR